MGLQDKALEKKLMKKLAELERLNDSVGPSPVRHLINAGVVKAKRVLRDFDEGLYYSEFGGVYAEEWHRLSTDAAYEEWEPPTYVEPKELSAEDKDLCDILGIPTD